MPELRRGLRFDPPGAIERFYQRLLQIDAHARDISLVDDALRLLVELTRCRFGYVELVLADDQNGISRSFDVDHRPHEVIAAEILRDIVTQAIARPRTIALPQRAILCVPLPSEVVAGVVWLEGKAHFSELDRERARSLAERLADLRRGDAPPRTLHEETRALHDRRIREALLLCHGNVSEAARVLGVSRSFVHAVLARRRR